MDTMLDRPERKLKSERAGGLTQTWYILQGARGAVQLFLMVPTERFEKLGITTMALDFGLHSPTPMFEGQEPLVDCPHSPGGTCYYLPSFKLAQATLDAFNAHGQDPEVIWNRLEEAYAAL